MSRSCGTALRGAGHPRQQAAHARAAILTASRTNARESPGAATPTCEVQLWGHSPSPPASEALKPNAILTCPSSRSVFNYTELLKFPRGKESPHIVFPNSFKKKKKKERNFEVTLYRLNTEVICLNASDKLMKF